MTTCNIQNKAPESGVFRPDPRRVFIYAILTAFILLFFSQKIFSQSSRRDELNGGLDRGCPELTSPAFLPRDSTVTVPCKAVWMSFDVYTQYYFARKKHDLLVQLVPDLISQKDSLQNMLLARIGESDSLIAVQKEIIKNHNLIKLELESENYHLKQLNKKYWIKNKLLGSAGIGMLAVLVILI